MSLNGQVTIGKWEYLSGAKSLLIDRLQDKILLNQNYIDPAVMVLKKDGHKEANLILANEILLPDLNVGEYLKQLYYKKNNIITEPLRTGEILEHSFIREWESSGGHMVTDSKVTIEGELIPDSILELANTNKKYIIRNSKIYKILLAVRYKTDKGIITIDKQRHYHPTIGDQVCLENDKAPDGKYRLGFMDYITVIDGKITKRSFL